MSVRTMRLNAVEGRQFESQESQSKSGAMLPLTASHVGRSLSASNHRIEILLTSKQASEVLKIHPKVLERMAKRGEVPALKVGKFWRYRATMLDAWINSRLQSGRQPRRMDTSF
jgi:excisionase family DNA binding protein